MTTMKNLTFERFIPKGKYHNTKTFNKNFFSKSINNAKRNIEYKKSIFHTFSKNFKLNFKPRELKEFKKYRRIIFIGMGGSILGSEAINRFLLKNNTKDVHFINNLDLDIINKVKNLKKSLFVIISKSGNTIETLSIVQSLAETVSFNKRNTLIITENKNNQLNLFAKKLNIKVIFHRNYVGGRYSIFSETALVPCYLLGLNIKKFRKNILNFLHKKKNDLENNLINLKKIYDSKKINSLILLTYSTDLKYFLLWCQQLIAESLGKNGKGIIPVISVAPRDHHSLLQLYLDGPKDKFFYIFSKNEKTQLYNRNSLFSKILNKSNSSKVLKEQKNAMVNLLREKNIPFLSINIKKNNEETLGELFSYFILETIFIGESLKLNPFNQPAVERLKILTKENIFKKNQK